MLKILLTSLFFLFLTACTTIRPIEYQHGKQFFDSGNYKAAFRLLLPVAYEGNCRAQYAIGYIYFYGLAGPIDFESGVFWMEKAAKQHYPPAQKALQMIQPNKVDQHALLEKPFHATYGQASSYEENLPALRQLSVTPMNHYSLQLQGDYDLESLKKVASKLNLAGQVSYGKTLRNNRDWYLLLYGDYKAPYLAKLAAMDLPASLQQLKPSIRKTDLLEHIA